MEGLNHSSLASDRSTGPTKLVTFKLPVLSSNLWVAAGELCFFFFFLSFSCFLTFFQCFGAITPETVQLVGGRPEVGAAVGSFFPGGPRAVVYQRGYDPFNNAPSASSVTHQTLGGWDDFAETAGRSSVTGGTAGAMAVDPGTAGGASGTAGGATAVAPAAVPAVPGGTAGAAAATSKKLPESIMTSFWKAIGARFFMDIFLSQEDISCILLNLFFWFLQEIIFEGVLNANSNEVKANCGSIGDVMGNWTGKKKAFAGHWNRVKGGIRQGTLRRVKSYVFVFSSNFFFIHF
jgi:hypothetical protein